MAQLCRGSWVSAARPPVLVWTGRQRRGRRRGEARQHRTQTPDHESLCETGLPGPAWPLREGRAPDATVPASSSAGPTWDGPRQHHPRAVDNGRWRWERLTLMPKGLQPARPSAGSVLGLPSGGGGATAGPTGQVWAEACRGLGAPGGRAGLRRLPAPASLPSVFGHISFRSDWELVKVDFRPWFSRRCDEGDYGSWDLTDLQVGPAPRGAPSPPTDPVPPGCRPPPPQCGCSCWACWPFWAAWARVCGYTQGHRGTGPTQPGASCARGPGFVGWREGNRALGNTNGLGQAPCHNLRHTKLPTAK